MDFNEKYINFIHWDYNPDLFGDVEFDKSTFTCAIGPRRHNETNKPTGFYFRWTCRLHSYKGIFLSCVGEDSFLIKNTKLLFPENIQFSNQQSLKDFNTALNKRLELIDSPIHLSYHQTRDEAQKFLDQLNQ